MKIKRVVGIWLTFAGMAFAGGTLDTSEILPLLDQKPKVKEFMFSQIELEHYGQGQGSRLGPHWRDELVGMRKGPYTIRAKAKGAKDWAFEVHVCTRTTFLDAKGNPISTLDDAIDRAVAFKEELTAVQLEELHSGRPWCPED